MGVLGADRLLEPIPGLETVEGVGERAVIGWVRWARISSGRCWRSLRPRCHSHWRCSTASPNRLRDRQRQRVVGVADDHPRRPLQGAEERGPGRHILASERLKAPHARHRRPLPRLRPVAPHGGQHVKATAGVRAAVDAEVLAVDSDRVRPAPGSCPAQMNSLQTSTQLATSCPSLAGERRLAPTRRDPTRLLARDLRRHPIAGPLGHQHQRLPDLPRREAVLPSARLPLPRLKRRRALNAIRVRVALTRQNRREPMLRISIPRPTPPPLPPMRRLAIPTTPHHPRPRVLGDRTRRNSIARPTYPCNRTYPLKSSRNAFGSDGLIATRKASTVSSQAPSAQDEPH